MKQMIKYKLMKKLIFLVFCLISMNVFSQKCDPIVTLGGKTGGFIKVEDILKDSALNVENNTGRVIGFTLTINVGGDLICFPSRLKKLTNTMIYYLTTSCPGTRIYFEDIKVKCNNDSIVNINNLVFKKDGPNADLLRNEDSVKGKYSCLLMHPSIYVYPDFSSKDTSRVTVTSFKMRAIQDDYYYEFMSKSNRLAPAMLDFIKKTNAAFTIFDIRALNSSKQRFVLNDIVIEKK
jgi:hypothetical protein